MIASASFASFFCRLTNGFNLRRERQAAGITSAKGRGVYKGRPPKIDTEAIKERLSKGLSPTRIARELSISRGTVYKAKAEMAQQ